MSGSIGERPVGEAESLARYIVRKEHLRSDGSIKPDPFIPYKWVELSVTRHEGLSEEGIWAAGELVASEVGKPLLGRADAQAAAFVRRRLRVVPDPLHNNPNHANVIDWPTDKQAQKEIALEVVKEVRYKAKPE